MKLKRKRKKLMETINIVVVKLQQLTKDLNSKVEFKNHLKKRDMLKLMQGIVEIINNLRLKEEKQLNNIIITFQIVQ